MKSDDCKNVIQSYIFSRIRSDLNITEMRILLRVVEAAQDELKGFVVKKGMGRKSHSLCGRVVEVPLRSVLPPGSHHYEIATAAFKSIIGKIVEYKDTEQNKWVAASLCPLVHVRTDAAIAELHIFDWVWDAILDFTQGYVQFDLSIALRLRSPYALKLFFLVANQKNVFCYSFNELYKLMGVEGKYSRPNDFYRKVIVPAAKELKEKAPWACDTAPRKDGRKLEYVWFFPFEQKQKANPSILEKQVIAQLPAGCNNREVWSYLRYNIGFEPREIAANRKVIDDFSAAVSAPVDFLATLRERSLKKGNAYGKGYFINAMRRALAKAREDTAGANL